MMTIYFDLPSLFLFCLAICSKMIIELCKSSCQWLSLSMSNIDAIWSNYFSIFKYILIWKCTIVANFGLQNYPKTAISLSKCGVLQSLLVYWTYLCLLSDWSMFHTPSQWPYSFVLGQLQIQPRKEWGSNYLNCLLNPYIA